MQHSEHNRFNSYRPAFLLGGLVSAQRTPAQERAHATPVIATQGSKNSLRLWFKSKVSAKQAN